MLVHARTCTHTHSHSHAILFSAGKPLLLVHGWPGSVWEFYKFIPLLTDPASHGGVDADAFEVIAPSIPGYGFSEQPHRKGSSLDPGQDVSSHSQTYTDVDTLRDASQEHSNSGTDQFLSPGKPSR